MSAAADLQAAVVEILAAEDALRVEVPVVAHVTHSLAEAIASTVAAHGLCVLVLPPLPTRAMQGVPFVFFEQAELRVRIIEQPALNELAADAYDLVDDVAQALHWQPRAIGSPLAPILSHPLQLAATPTQLVDDPTYRIIDVLFEATFGFEQPD